MKVFRASSYKGLLFLLSLITTVFFIYSCNNSSASNEAPPPPVALPVIEIKMLPATTYREYSSTLEGKVNVEIRPQVDGYIEKIFVDEGAYVKAGQPLFKINDRVYREQLNNAKSVLMAARANLKRAQVEVDKLTPLVLANVVSDVQLQTAKAAYDAAKAAVSQSQASVGNAEIDVSYTSISAPVSGYLGRIPFKTGSLVGKGEAQPLTLLSDVREIYAYFSLSEVDFLAFKNQFPGNTIEEKVKQLPPVELIMADGQVYADKGRIETIEGQFDKTMGAINFRATFPNPQRALRSGSTGKIRIPQFFKETLVVPQDATFEIQDKVFVFALSDSNKVESRPITITGKTTNYYFIEKGLAAGEKIVYAGMGNIRDGMVIMPEPMSTDSLLRAKPL
jgi:membrane fusion protein (multidrug efflux system)